MYKKLTEEEIALLTAAGCIGKQYSEKSNWIIVDK